MVTQSEIATIEKLVDNYFFWKAMIEVITYEKDW